MAVAAKNPHSNQKSTVKQKPLYASDFDRTRYFKAADHKGEPKLTIDHVTVDEMQDGTEKLVVWFVEDERGLPLNKTNNRCLRGAFGDDTREWPGHEVVLFTIQAPNPQGVMGPALRVRAAPQTSKKPTAKKRK